MIHHEKPQNSRRNPQVISFGEILFDCFEGSEYIGGAPLNFACYIRQFGISVGMVSAVGADTRGQIALRHLSNSGVQADGVSVRLEPTGVANVTLVNGNPEFKMEKDCAWKKIALPTELLRIKPNLLYFGTMAQTTPRNLETLNALCSLKPHHALLDLNLRPQLYSPTLVLGALGKATILKMNEEEWRTIREITKLKTPDDLFNHFRLRMIAITRGSNGAEFYIRDSQYSYTGTKVESVDQIGAGDAFTAALAAGVMRHAKPDHILRVACEAGAIATQQMGAVVNLPKTLQQAFPQYERR